MQRCRRCARPRIAVSIFLVNLEAEIESLDTALTIKQQLHNLCTAYIAQREQQIGRAIADARESVANETKSSAGDKYETGREMMQQEIDLNMARLAELQIQKAALVHSATDGSSKGVVPGSVVFTNNGAFYVSISAGQLKVDGKTYYAVSPASPVGSALVGHEAGHTFQLNGKQFVIEGVE